MRSLALGFLLFFVASCASVQGPAVDQHYQRVALQAALASAKWPGFLRHQRVFMPANLQPELAQGISDFLEERLACHAAFDISQADYVLVPRVKYFGPRVQIQSGPLLIVQSYQSCYLADLSCEIFDPATACSLHSLSMNAQSCFKQVTVLGGIQINGPSQTQALPPSTEGGVDAIRQAK